MSTLAIMKARIASELGQRTDLADQIGYAINDAIAAYENYRFWFNESRAITFSTVALQEFYTSSDSANIATIQKFDYVMLYQGDIPHQLTYANPETMEWQSINGSTSGTPWEYTWYGNAIRLYPVPDQAYTVRIGASVKVPAPATDSETGNAWMVHAERLIRSRAKLELAIHVEFDSELANNMAAAVEEAYTQLKSRTNILTQADQGRIRAMEF